MEAVLFWDATLGAPDEAAVLAAAQAPGDVWHAGLSLGMGDRPRMIDYVDPVWRFNRDPRPNQPGVSWRLSLRACLVRADVVRRLGGPDPDFETLTGAALELGHRWIGRGAMMRHVPYLLPDTMVGAGLRPAPTTELTLADELRFARRRYGRVWTAWAASRAVRHGGGSAAHVRPRAATFVRQYM